MADEESQMGQVEEESGGEQQVEDTITEADSDQPSVPADADGQTEEQGFQDREEDTELDVHQEGLQEDDET